MPSCRRSFACISSILCLTPSGNSFHSHHTNCFVLSAISQPNQEPAVSDYDHIVKANVMVHQVMVMDVLQSCHDTGDKAAQLCAVPVMQARAPTSTVLVSVLRSSSCFEMFCLTWGASASLTIHLNMCCLRMCLMQYRYSRQFWGLSCALHKTTETNNAMQTRNTDT